MSQNNDLTSSHQQISAARIVFFDGVCSLCNGSVDFLMKRDKKHVLHFASLQGESAKQYLSEADRSALDSILYWRAGDVLAKSQAALAIAEDLGGIWQAFLVLKIFPRPILDWMYDIVSRNRYKWFGKRDACRMPTKQEQGFLLN